MRFGNRTYEFQGSFDTEINHVNKGEKLTMNTDRAVGVAANQVVQRMGEAAENFLAGLAVDQRRQAQFALDDHTERTSWYYFPTEHRHGLPFTEMDRNQQRLAQKLIISGLSQSAYVTATTIMGLETTLDAIEGFVRDLWWRDSRLYYVSIFGEPNDKAAWGWRFEGHHISLNYTLVGGQIVAPTPTFFGSNPGETSLLGGHSLRPLASIEDLARTLLHELSAEQRAQVLLSPVAPPDMTQLNRPYIIEEAIPGPVAGIVDPPGVAAQYANMENFSKELGATHDHLAAVRYTSAPKGIAAAAMNGTQREILLALIGDYIHRMPDELAEIELNKLHERGIEKIHFAWAGGVERRQPHSNG